MNKYLVADLQKGIDYLKKNCNAVYVITEIDHLGRLILKGSDMAGNAVCVTIYDESTAKMPDVNKTERLV